MRWIEVGDLVRMDYTTAGKDGYHWQGICTWEDGYKYEFLVNGEFDVWKRGDLEYIGVEVISENR